MSSFIFPSAFNFSISASSNHFILLPSAHSPTFNSPLATKYIPIPFYFPRKMSVSYRYHLSSPQYIFFRHSIQTCHAHVSYLQNIPIDLIFNFTYPSIFSTISPCNLPLTMHFIFLPLTSINSFIWPHISACPMDIVIVELSFITRPIRKIQNSFAMLFPFLVMALIHSIIRPIFCSISVLFIIQPFAFVLSSIDMNINTLAVSFIIFPFTFVNVTISMNELSLEK